MKRAVVLALVMSLASCAAAPDFNREMSGGVEEVYVARTVRVEHAAGASAACAAAPFKVSSDSVYDLWSIEQGPNGRVTNSYARPAGSFRACIGSLTDGRAIPMYATFDTNGLSYSGLGECLLTKTPPPEKTLLPLNCILNLTELPAPYIGGILISNTLAPIGRDLPVDAHVPGYLSTSVVTTRLWRKKD